MEQLIILALFVAASLISSYVQNKKKREEEAREDELRREGGHAPAPPPQPRAPSQQWPRSPSDWQEELRRLLQPQEQADEAPPVIRPASKPPQPTLHVPRTPPPSPPPIERRIEPKIEVSLDLDDTAAKARELHRKVKLTARALEEKVDVPRRSAQPVQRDHRPSPLLRWTRNRRSVREAFIASLVFSPPPSLTPPEARPGS